MLTQISRARLPFLTVPTTITQIFIFMSTLLPSAERPKIKTKYD